MEDQSKLTFKQMLSALLRSNRRHARYIQAFACLAVLVAVAVPLVMRQYGVAMTTTETRLACQYAGNGAHTHNADCYDAYGNLVCPLPEKPFHTHTADCYATERVLTCALPETEGHTHGEACYDEDGNLTCTIPEEPAHTHTDACYETRTTDQLICGMEETTEEHVHGPACFETVTVELPDPEPEPEPTTTTPAEPEATVPSTPEEDPTPAQEFTDVLKKKDENGNEYVYLVVQVKAPQGALPKGSIMTVAHVDLNKKDDLTGLTAQEKLDEVLRKEAGEEAAFVQTDAVDITFKDAQGNRVDPAKKVEVRVTTSMIRTFSDQRTAGDEAVTNNSLLVLHVVDHQQTKRTDAPNAELIRKAYLVNQDEKDTSTGHEDTILFEATEFSPYIVARVDNAALAPEPEPEPEQPAETEQPAAEATLDLTTEDQPAEAEPERPAQSFTHRFTDTNGQVLMRVDVLAPEGAFPLGTTMQVKWVDASHIEESVTQAVSERTYGKLRDMRAVDITFIDADGHEIEPAKKITVTFASDLIDTQDDAYVVHVDDEGKSEVIDALGSKELESREMADQADELVFESDAFSTYVVAVTTLHKELTASDGATYDITVDAPAEAGIPQDAELRVSEIAEGDERYEEYLSQTLKALGEDATADNTALARFFDIKIYSGEQEIQPQAPVKVDMQLSDAANYADVANTNAVHFANDSTKAAPEVLEIMQNGTVTSFDANGFSVYGVVYTVDFHYEFNGQVFEYSIPGGDTVSIRDLATTLHLLDETDGNSKASDADVDQFINDIEDVKFSSDDLMAIVPIKEGISVNGLKQKYDLDVQYAAGLSKAQLDEMNEKVYYGPDYVLVSLKPFDTQETLTFSMNDGAVFTIVVTDAQMQRNVISASGETYEIAVIYDSEAGIPDDATLKVQEISAGTENYAQCLQDAADKLGVESDAVPFARFFDIEIWSGNKKIEPTSQVDVTIKLADIPTDGDVDQKVVHFEGQADEPEVVESEPDINDALLFSTDSFSVYGVIAEPGPSGVNDLAGRSFTISKGSYVITSDITGSQPSRFRKTTNEKEAATWQFEATGTNGVYNIFTYVDGAKKYMQLNKETDQRAAAALGDSPQAFTVTHNNSGYHLRATSGGTSYYLNEWEGTGGSGFAGYYQSHDANDSLTFNFTQPEIHFGSNSHYMTLVKYNDKYYIVNNDATLTEVEYDEATKKVAVDDPMLWTVEEHHIYFNSVQTGFNSGQTASDFFRRYLDPTNASDAFADEDSSNVTVTKNYSWYSEELGRDVDDTTVTDRTNMENLTYVNIAYSSNDSRDTYVISHNDQYLGLQFDSEGNPIALAGGKARNEAAEILFADPTKVKNAGYVNNTVNHIDISIAGTASVTIPLAYGNYYGPEGDSAAPIKTVTTNTKISLSEAQMVNKADLKITTDDIKGATITAARADTGESLDDAFYITGYSGNVTTPYSADQVRIEGSFLAADLRGTQYETIDERYSYNDSYRDNVRAARLNNKVEYTVTAIKPLSYYLIDPEVGQLYDEDGEPIIVTVDVAFSASFNYWDDETASNGGNECPPLQNNADWKRGDIPWHNASGMDFVLGGDADNPNSPLVALEITKVIMDDAGNRIELKHPVTNYFDIYENKNANRNGVAGLHVDEYGGEDDRDGSIRDGYELWRTKRLTVDHSGSAIVFDFNASDAMYYIEERHDKDSLPDTVTDLHGNEWNYVKTYIETEYVRRGDKYDDKAAYPSPMHVTEEYTRDDEHYASWPEVAGHFTRLDHVAKKEGFLEFYVYNIYQKGVTLDVEKTWDTDEVLPTNTEVTVDLYYAKRQIADSNGPISSIADWPDKTDYDRAFKTEDASLFDSELVKTLTLRPENSFKGTFEELPHTVTDAQGNVYEVDYFAKESKVMINGLDATSHYSAATSKTEPVGEEAVTSDGKVTINNTVETLNVGVEKVWDPTPIDENASVTVELRRYKKPLPALTATVTKVWDDDGNRDHIRPGSITVKLSNGETKTLNEDNDWTASVENLPMTATNDNDTPIDYTWTEELPEGYTGITTTSGMQTVITNTHSPETVDLTLTINWDDSNNSDGSRPASVTATLSNGETVTLTGNSTANSWTKTITVPKNYNGVPISYSWSSVPEPHGYSTTDDTTDGNTKTVTFRHQATHYTLNITTTGRYDGAGPNPPTGVRYPAGTSVTLTIDKNNSWDGDTYTITGLPGGNRSFNGSHASFTFVMNNNVNLHITSDRWYQESNEWWNDWLTYTLSPQPNRNAAPLRNTVMSMSGTRALAARSAAGTLLGATGAGAQPPAAPAGYEQDTSFSATLTLNNTSGWSQQFPDSYPKTDLLGNPYYYYVVETNCTSGDYHVESYTGGTNGLVSGGNGTITITNKQEPTQLTVSKVWSDSDDVNHSGDTITYHLYRVAHAADGTEFVPEEISASGVTSTFATGFTGTLSDPDWSETVTNLPKGGMHTLEGGNAVPVTYSYYVSEDAFAGYHPVITGGENEGVYSFTITNTPNGSYDTETALDIQKLWKASGGAEDPSNHAGETITVEVTQKKYPANALFSDQTSHSIWPVIINLYNANGQLSNLSKVVYLPSDVVLTLVPTTGNNGHKVTAAGTDSDGTYRSGTSLTLSSSAGGKVVTLTLNNHDDTWGEDWSLSESANPDYLFTESDLPEKINTGAEPTTTTFEYAMSYDGQNTTLTPSTGAQGQGAGGQDPWKGTISELPFYQIDKGSQVPYLYLYKVTEVKIGEENVSTTQATGFNGETSHYFVKWEGSDDEWTITNQKKPTVDIDLLKVDSTTIGGGKTPKYLAGATFYLTKKTDQNREESYEPTVISLDDDETPVVVDKNDHNKFTIPTDDGVKITGLMSGTYVLHEVSAPDGYNVTEGGWTFTVNVDNTSAPITSVTKADGSDVTTDVASGITLTIPNPPGASLPEAGGPGTYLYTLCGLALFAAAGYVGLASKRTARKEVA